MDAMRWIIFKWLQAKKWVDPAHSMFLVRSQKLQKIVFLAFFFLPGLFLSPAFSLESAEQIVKELDAHYYYPQQHGLEKLSVRIDWEQLDVITDSGRYLKNPPVAFFWEKSPAGWSKGVFKLADKSFEVSEERSKELLEMLENYKEIVIPQTLAEKMSNHKGQIKVAKKNKRLIEFVSRKTNATVQKYDLMVDLQERVVRKFRMHRIKPPVEVKSDVRYTQKEGKWLIMESRSKFRVGEMDYNETTEYIYRRVKNFWLVGKMIQTIKTDGRIIQSFIFRFRDYHIN